MKKPYECSLLPYELQFDTELINLLSRADSLFSEVKGLIEALGIDKEYFLLSIAKAESFKSTEIEGTDVSQSDVFALEYDVKPSDDKKEIINYVATLQFAREYINNGNEVTKKFINLLHEKILDSTRGSQKQPGKIRIKQNWIGVRGVPMEFADFIPPKPESVESLVDNFIENFTSDVYPALITVAVAHAQFETIHPYNDGNGRLGRLLIPIQMALINEETPLLFISEIIEQYKPTYARRLNEFRQGKPENFVKFFLQCVIDQSTAYKYRVLRIMKLIESDKKIVANLINSKYAEKVYSLMVSDIVLNYEKIMNATGCSQKTAANYIKVLLDNKVLVKSSTPSYYVYESLHKIYLT